MSGPSQRCPILRTRKPIVQWMATLNHCQRRSPDISNLVQRTFSIPDSRTSYFLVDTLYRHQYAGPATGLAHIPEQAAARFPSLVEIVDYH